MPAPRARGADGGVAEFEQQFIESWRKDLLDRAWTRWPSSKKTPASPITPYSVRKVDHPDLPSAELAEKLSNALNKPLTAGAVRQTLQRSRRTYVDYLLTEVRASLDHPTRDDLEQELIDLNLLHYCRPFLMAG